MATQHCKLIVIDRYANAFEKHVRRRCRQVIQAEINSKPETERKRLQREMRYITKSTPLRYLETDLELLGIAEKLDSIKRGALSKIKVRRTFVMLSDGSKSTEEFSQ